MDWHHHRTRSREQFWLNMSGMNLILLQTVHENRIYSLEIVCGEAYPDEPPTIKFVSRINIPFVNQTDGTIDAAKLPVLTNWSRSNSIETLLVEIRRSVHAPHSLSLCRILIQHYLQRDGYVQQQEIAPAAGGYDLLSV